MGVPGGGSGPAGKQTNTTHPVAFQSLCAVLLALFEAVAAFGLVKDVRGKLPAL